jgi:hypothetical protein
MGIHNSKQENMTQILDYIATHYIVTLDFQGLRRLYDKEYCDKLVILTSDIIQRYFTNLEISYLAERIKDGEKDNVMFFNHSNLKQLDVQNSIKKKAICLSIAKFYIKIAHLFSAIVTTLNPIYTYKDEEGNNVQVNLFEKATIPINVEHTIHKFNICEKRINILNYDQNSKSINPKLCDLEDSSLIDEPGVPELEELYYDDNYDLQTGKFTGMTDETRKLFEGDLLLFYNVFTDNNVSILPENIKRFSDIKLRNYINNPGCEEPNRLLNMEVKDTLSNKLFNDYAVNLKNMVQRAKKGQESLLTILNDLFSYTIDPQTNKKQIRVHPKLTEEKLQKLIIHSRELIIQLYLGCEIDFVNGLKIYEAIVEKKILETAQKQIESLEHISTNLLSHEDIQKTN